MKEFTKRLREQADCIGMVQESRSLDTSAPETNVARMVLEDMTRMFPQALLLNVRVTIDARVWEDADAAKGDGVCGSTLEKSPHV